MWLHCKYAGKWFHESEIFNHSSEWQAEGKMLKQVPLRTFKINMKSIFSVICILSLRSNEARYLVEPDKRYSRKLIKTVYLFLYIVRHQTSKPKQLLLSIWMWETMYFLFPSFLLSYSFLSFNWLYLLFHLFKYWYSMVRILSGIHQPYSLLTLLTFLLSSHLCYGFDSL